MVQKWISRCHTSTLHNLVHPNVQSQSHSPLEVFFIMLQGEKWIKADAQKDLFTRKIKQIKKSSSAAHCFPSSACHFLQGQGAVGGEAGAQVETMCKAPGKSEGEEGLLADAHQRA